MGTKSEKSTASLLKSAYDKFKQEMPETHARVQRQVSKITEKPGDLARKIENESRRQNQSDKMRAEFDKARGMTLAERKAAASQNLSEARKLAARAQSRLDKRNDRSKEVARKSPVRKSKAGKTR